MNFLKTKKGKAVNPSVFWVLLFACACARGEDRERESLTAQSIVANAISTYQSLITYRDEGTAKTHSLHDLRIAEIASFSTSFRRPDRFRFEYASDLKVDILSSEGASYLTTSYSSVAQRGLSISQMIRSTTGVTHGVSAIIPTMITTMENGGSYLGDLGTIELLSEQVIRDVPCYRIQGIRYGNLVEIWIDKSSFLILQIIEFNQTPIGSVESVFEFEPEMNVLLAKDVFDGPVQQDEENADKKKVDGTEKMQTQ